MKKVVAILLLFVYAASIAGFGIKTFYCCSKLRSVSAILLLDRSSGNAADKNDDGCCNTKYSFFKIKDNHKAASALTVPVQPVVDVLFDFPSSPVGSCFYGNIQVAHRSNAPPPFVGRPTYMINCVYRI